MVQIADPNQQEILDPYEGKRVKEPIIWARGLSKQFGEEMAVNEVSFEMPAGSIFGFIGPSGSGKTTTIRLLTGVYIPSAGEARVFSRHPKNFTRKERERIGYMPQNFVLYPDLTVWENLSFAASIYGVSLRRAGRLKQLLDFVELLDHKDKQASKISGGMQRRLSLASTLIHRPDLLFLDEPTGGIDPVLRRKFWDYFEDLKSGGATLFVTTQYVSEAAYCDQVGILAEGRLLVVDTPEGLRRRAYGGEVIDLRTNERISFDHVQRIKRLPYVTGRVDRVEENEVRIIVGEASTAMPALLDWCRDQNLTIESIQEYLPPFDDVFVHLIERFYGNG